jgi:hypothetical protein
MVIQMIDNTDGKDCDRWLRWWYSRVMMMAYVGILVVVTWSINK